MYLNHVQLIGFLGKDPEKRQVRGNGANFTVLSVANRLGESIADTIHKGDHVLVDGQLVSSKYERENGESKKRKSAKFAIFWSVRANSIRRLSRSEAEIPAAAASSESGAESGDTPF